jgi:hypothetical protein
VSGTAYGDARGDAMGSGGTDEDFMKLLNKLELTLFCREGDGGACAKYGAFLDNRSAWGRLKHFLEFISDPVT